MGDFGTAIIFFVTFLIISFLRSGDFSKLFLMVGAAAVGGFMILRFKPYVANRFASWGHVWDAAVVDAAGFQQSRTMSAAASGGLVGVGAGEGWLEGVPAADTDMVFGMLIEEWGLIIAVLAVLSIVTLSLFAYRSILAGRSTFYTIGACGAMSMFIFQTMRRSAAFYRSYVPVRFQRRNQHDSVVGFAGISESGGHQRKSKHCCKGRW